jgi:glycosyltransferase involved in cell wall biosynthesis
MTVTFDKKNLTVSVILINHNYEQFVGKAIESVLGQSYTNIELIVVDDASSDKSVEIIEKYKASVDILHRETISNGPAHSRNLGLSFASGAYIAFLDADDYWEPNKISEQLEYLIGNSLDGVYSTVKLLEFGESIPFFSENPKLVFSTYLNNPLGVGGYLMSTLLVSRNIPAVTEGFEERLRHGEDYEFGSRLFSKANIQCLDLPLTTIRRHPMSLSSFYTPRFLFDSLLWGELFLTNFKVDLSRRQRLTYVVRLLIGLIKTIFKFKNYRSIFFLTTPCFRLFCLAL